MEQASEQMQSGQSASAASSQREALEALERAQQELQRDVRPDTPQERERAEALAQEQEQIRRELLELARRNKERRNAQPLESLDRAGERAGQAGQELSEGDLSEAQRQEQEVQRELQNAQDELGEEEEQYQELRQEELLFRIGEEIKALIAGHTEAQAAVREIDSGRAADEKPSRAERLRLRRVSDDEGALGMRAGKIATDIEAEQSLVFAHVLREVERDLARVARDLGETGNWQTGDRVQAVQEDVAESLGWVLEALDSEQRRREEEAQRRQQEGQQNQQQQNQQSQNRLVPDVAELQLLRRMELETLDRLDRLMLINPELAEAGAEVDPSVLDDVLRLAERHERTSKLFEAFRTRLGLPAPEEESRP